MPNTTKNPKARKPATKVKTAKGEVLIPRAPTVVGEVTPAPKFKVVDRVRKLALDKFKHCFLISLSFKRPGAHKKVKNKKDVIREGHNTDLLDVGKRIMSWPEYAAFTAFESSCRDYVERHCIPMPTGVNFFKNGTYILPRANVNRVYRYLDSRRGEYDQLIANLDANYPQRMEEDRRALGVDFNPKDYLPQNEIGSAFDYDFFLDKFDPLSDRNEEGIDPDIIAAEDVRGRERIQKCVQSMEFGLADAVMEVYKYLLERLCDDETPGGKRRHIRADAIDNKLEIVRQFRVLNLTENPLLGKNIEQLEKIFEGVTVNALRHDTELRDDIRKQAEAALQQLGKLVVESQGERKMINVFAAKQQKAA
jgi:hypothetical protein